MLKSLYQLYARITGRKLFIGLNKGLFNLSLRGLGIYNYQNLKISGESYFIKKIIVPRAGKKEKYTVFDVGANVGEYSKMISDIIKNSEIFSIKPHPKNFEKLKENLKNYKNIKFLNCAVSSSCSKMNLNDYGDNDGSPHASLNSKIFNDVYHSNSVTHEVNVLTLEKIVEENSVQEIDFLKIDVEGCELDVLNGAIKLLDSKKIKVIQFEFTQLNSITRIYFKDFYDILSKNYKIYRLLPAGLLEVKEYSATPYEIFAYQNYVAIIKE